MHRDDKRASFRALHETGCFVIPNPWDLGSAKLLEHLGFKALATTSSGYAWTRARRDYDVPLEDVLSHLTELCAASSLPINADFLGGFAKQPADIARNFARASSTGIAGMSIEDYEGDAMYELPLAVERVRAARAGLEPGVLLVARAEMALHGGAASTAIDRLVAFADAGADCLYAPGVWQRDDIAAMVRAVAPKPVNMLMFKPGYTLAELADLGVRRVSVGGALARVAWGAIQAAAKQLLDGSFDGLGAAMPGAALNAMFSPD